jgi:ABC-type multidrug transport system ATPase subunit
MIYGAAIPSEGTIRVFGTDVTRDPRAVRARLGVTLQENALIEVVSPLENLRIFRRYHLLGRDAIESRAHELLDFLELRSHAEVPVEALSGGFKRRLAIAISLMNAPELLILDEPTTGLDPGSAKRFGSACAFCAPREPRSCLRPTIWKRPSGCAIDW